MRLGVLGGTFDPVHRGHLELAQAALKQLKLDKFYMLLSPSPPHKHQRNITPIRNRRAMLQHAIKKKPRIFLADWELRRKGPSYTVTTLKNYKKRFPRREIYFVMGSDLLAGFGRWKNPQQILKLCQLVVGKRPGAAAIKTKYPVQILKGRFPDISSSDVRYDVRCGRPLTNLIPPGVRAYIRSQRLYQDG